MGARAEKLECILNYAVLACVTEHTKQKYKTMEVSSCMKLNCKLKKGLIKKIGLYPNDCTLI